MWPRKPYMVSSMYALPLRFTVEQQWLQAKQASLSMRSSKMPLPKHWDWLYNQNP